LPPIARAPVPRSTAAWGRRRRVVGVPPRFARAVVGV